MTPSTLRRAAAALLVALLAAVPPAAAHHGWAWTDDGGFELTGTIREIYLGNPHATLDVEVEGEMWRVELAPPSRTARAGFVEGVAAPGDEVTALGQRSTDPEERRMKAERVTVGGARYDVYPDRLAGS